MPRERHFEVSSHSSGEDVQAEAALVNAIRDYKVHFQSVTRREVDNIVDRVFDEKFANVEQYKEAMGRLWQTQQSLAEGMQALRLEFLQLKSFLNVDAIIPSNFGMGYHDQTAWQSEGSSVFEGAADPVLWTGSTMSSDNNVLDVGEFRDSYRYS